MNKRLRVDTQQMRVLLLMTVIVILLSGCMYPKSDTSSGAVVSKEAVRNVQAAVEQYLTTTGVLPMHNSDTSVSRYEKFRVDFGKLKEGGYLENIPNSAFESGGNFYFLILNESEQPIIKAQSILLTQKANDVQNAVSDYMAKQGELPASTEVSKDMFYVDFDLLNMKKPTLNSIYSGNTSEFIVSKAGTVYIDYAPEIMQLVQKDQSLVVSEELDLRELLIANSDYVPVKSATYKLIEGEPVAFEQ